MHADIVVVGAGAAGCVVASRLSERDDQSVVLLEAGSGRGTGGSAVGNMLVATVGEPDDYDEWERVYGCEGWSWRDVRPWFRRARLPTHRPQKRELGPLAAAVLSSVDGAQRARLTRVSRANLEIRSNSVVDRVLLDSRRAVGVRLADGESIDAGLVVVCAGALHTPAVLLRSEVDREGIGQGLHDHPSISLPMTLRHAQVDPTTLPISVLTRGSHVDRHDVQIIPFESADGPALMAGAMRVYSRGTVRLAAADPTIDPIVEFNKLSDQRDLELLRAAAHEATRIATSKAISKVATANEVSITDDRLRAAVGDYFHAAGSCRMGASSDPLAVVDPRCRVIGYESLVVCDASVIPNLPRANPYLPVVMIAERVAAMIS